ncbi:hypothetical protein ACFXJ5_03405 [Streptomyces sp. NPDC059373]
MLPSGDRPHSSRAARRAALSVTAFAVAFAALTACSSSSGSAAGAADAKAATGAASTTAAPGKYRVLPEPCGAVSANTLKSLVPNAKDYAGTADLTYDTDRRVGCGWTGSTSNGNRYLHVDFLRVVSYDNAVSDESQATTDYDEKALAAGIETATSASAGPSDSASASSSASATPSASASDSAAALAPRALSGLGDSAYLDDVLKTQDSGVHRDITVVFRKANVLVTVEYSQWSTDNSVAPAPQELQDGAREVAGEVADQFAR